MITIEFDRESRDFAVMVDGQYRGSRKSRVEAETLAAEERGKVARRAA